MTIMDLSQLLGNFGVFIGSIAVVATLVYLGIQVRHSKESMDANTTSLDASRKLALVQTYQARTALVVEQMTSIALAEGFSAITVKVEDFGYDALTPQERVRWNSVQAAHMLRLDNLFFARQQGFLDNEFYRDNFIKLVKGYGPGWKALGFMNGRQSFKDEVERILGEEAQQP